MSIRAVTSPSLDARHGFFTRLGGVSEGLYAGLNCGLGSNDHPKSVLENRGYAAAQLGCKDFVNVHQIHSANVVVAEDVDAKDRPQADALVTATANLCIGVLTADCSPVLFADQTNGVIGAAHAGWKGALSGVLDNTINKMIALGAQRTEITAVAGPTISQANYEVGQDFLEYFEADDPEALRFFAQGQSSEKYRFDLPGYVLWRLRQAGVRAEWTGQCTYADAAQFFSYRRATHNREKDYGRQASLICLHT
ncbi:MAG: peptidoglycan editing factor PgeF [Pseudomonadota bacterium]